MATSNGKPKRLIAEARRRRVFPVIAIYIVSAWVILQVASTLFPGWGIPDRAIQFVVYALIAGFPIAIVFGWRYDLTTNGIRRTPEATAEELENAADLRRTDLVLLGVMAAGIFSIGVWLAGRVIQDEPPILTSDPNSIAVMALEGDTSVTTVDLSELSNGIVTALIYNPKLKVTGRESSFYFAERDAPLERVAEVLNVRSLLTGQVSQSAGSARIKMQLVSMPDEETVWAQTFDVPAGLTSQIIEPIATSVAGALGIQPAVVPATIDPEIRESMKVARDALQSRDFDRAMELADLAVEAEPDIVDTHLTRAHVYMFTYGHTGRPGLSLVLQVMGDALDQAEALGVDNSAEYFYLRAVRARRIIRAWGTSPALEKDVEENFDRAIALNPSDALPYVSYSIYFRSMRRYAEAADLLERAIEYDPLYPGALIQYSRNLSALGRRDEALETVLKVPQYHGHGHQDVASIYLDYQQLDEAIKWLTTPTDPSKNLLRMTGILWALMRAPDLAVETWTGIADDPVYGPTVRGASAAISGDYHAAIRIVADGADPDDPESDIGPASLARIAEFELRIGNPERAVQFIERVEANLTDPGAPVVTERNLENAITLACALNELEGNDVRVGILTSQIINLVRGRSAIGFDGVKTAPAQVYACQNNHSLAIDSFETAYEEGLRDIYRYYGQLPYPLERLRGDERFDQLLAAINKDLDEMRDRAIGNL